MSMLYLSQLTDTSHRHPLVPSCRDNRGSTVRSQLQLKAQNCCWSHCCFKNSDCKIPVNVGDQHNLE